MAFNKLTTVSEVFPEFMSHLSKLIKTEEGTVGTSNLYPNQTEVVGDLGTYYLQSVSEVGGLVGLSALTPST